MELELSLDIKIKIIIIDSFMVKDPQNQGPFRRIDKIVNGKPFLVLAIDKNNSYEVDKKYRITIKAVGNQIKVFIDGSEILSAQDDTFKTGKLGFMTYADSGYFDNVCVSIADTQTTKPTLTSFSWTGT
jgi:NAD kinase